MSEKPGLRFVFGRVLQGLRRVGLTLRRIPGWIKRGVDLAAPGPRSLAGARYGALGALVVFGGLQGLGFKSPMGVVVDVVLGALVGALAAYLGVLGLRLVMALLRLVPRFVGPLGTASLLLLMFFLAENGLQELGVSLALGMVAAEAVLGGSLAFLSGPGFRRAGWASRTSAVALLGAALAANAWGIWWLSSAGTEDHLLELAGESGRAGRQGSAVASWAGELADPSQPGEHTVLTLTYGSGSDLYREEFGDGVDLVTEPVDATPFVKGYKGWRRKARELYWGFGPEEFPRNGRVWYPQGEGPFPLVLIVHGNHNMMEFSDSGYAYLGELLASRGFVFVSVDENFLNGSVFGGIPRENDARGWMLLKHLELWRQWNDEDGHPFAGKVNLERIALIGHSRGGEAAAIAAAFNRLARYPDDATVEFDFGFAIVAVLAIAPSDGQYRPADHPTPLLDVNYLVVQGGHDSDVSMFLGDRQYRRVRFSQAGEGFKASVYIYRANHGQFNTVWGRTDRSAPRSFWLNLAPLLDGDAQRQVARTYFTAFLEATLHDRRGYVEVFRDPGLARQWLPDDLYVTRFQDSSFRLVAGYEEDVDVTTATLDEATIEAQGLAVWREEDVKLRSGATRGDHSVVVGWRSDASAEPASYTLHLPAGSAEEWGLDETSVLVCQLAASAEELPEADDEADPEEVGGGEEDGNGPAGEADEAGEAGDREAADEESDEESPGQGGDLGGEDAKAEAARDGEDLPAEPLDFTWELVTRGGTRSRLPLSRFGLLMPPLTMRFSKSAKLESRYGSQPEAVFQTFQIPLSAFVEATPELDLNQLEAVRLVFDGSEEAVIILDELGFARRRDPSSSP